MPHSERFRILFALFEWMDHYAIRDLIQLLKKDTRFSYRVLTGFTYDRYIQNHTFRTKSYPAVNPLKNLISRLSVEDNFSFLLKEKINSRECSILWKRLQFESQRLETMFKHWKPDLAVIPEDFCALHGGLAAQMAKHYGIKTLMIPPFYYEWIGARPVMGTGLANHLSAQTYFYPKRLKQSGAGGTIIRDRPYRLNFPPPDSFSGKIPRGRFFLATLQDNDDQESFISLLLDTFVQIPNSHLMIKFHPQTKAAVKRHIQKKFRAPNISFDETSALDRFRSGALAVITLSSSSALWAVKHKIPAILVCLNAFFPDLSDTIRNYDFLPAASDPDELLVLIKKLTHNPFRKACLRAQEKLRKELFSTGRRLLDSKYIKKLITG